MYCDDTFASTHSPSLCLFCLSLHLPLSLCSVYGHKGSVSGFRRQFSNGPNSDPNTGAAGANNPIIKGRAHHIRTTTNEFSDEEDDFSSHSSDSPPDDLILPAGKAVVKPSTLAPHNRVRFFGFFRV